MADVITCPHADACGGCPLIALPYPEQLARKHARVARAFARFPLLARVPVAPVAPAEPTTAYRARTKLVVGPTGVGLYGGGGHTLVDLPACRVQQPSVAAVVERVRGYVASGAIAAHAEGTPGLRGLDVRGTAGDDAVLVTLIVDDEPGARAAAEALGERLAREEARVAGVFVAPHAGESARLLAPGAYRVAGEARVRDAVGPTLYVAGPGAFVQAHRGQAARVHELVAAHLLGAGPASAGATPPRVLDLYAGGGGIGLALARRGAAVTAVESYAPALEDARASAALNGVAVETLAADAEGALDELLARRARFDAVVLNPPRRGCAPGVREKVARLSPARVAYVSCDPETLARDLDHLRRLGLAAVQAAPVDMIPLTDEVETVALLAPAPPPHPPILAERGDVLVISKWPDEPLAPNPTRGGSTLGRVRRRAGWREAVAISSLDEGTSGACAVARSSAARPRALTLRTTFVALVRGVTHGGGALRAHGADAAALRYKRLATVAGQSLVRVVGDAGGSAVVRQAFAAIGHPVVGDARNGHAPTNRHFAERHALTRPFLHAARLELGVGGETIAVDAPLAPDLALALARMGGDPEALLADASTS